MYLLNTFDRAIFFNGTIIVLFLLLLHIKYNGIHIYLLLYPLQTKLQFNLCSSLQILNSVNVNTNSKGEHITKTYIILQKKLLESLLILKKNIL